MEGVIPLLDKNNDDGNVKGKLEDDHFAHWIGRNSDAMHLTPAMDHGTR